MLTTDELMQYFAVLVAMGVSVHSACASLGIHPDTGYTWYRRDDHVKDLIHHYRKRVASKIVADALHGLRKQLRSGDEKALAMWLPYVHQELRELCNAYDHAGDHAVQ